MASAFARFPMFRFLVLLVTAFLVPPPLFSANSTPSLLAEASIFEDLHKSIESEPNLSLTCVEKHLVAATSCALILSPFYGLEGAVGNESLKANCCLLQALGKCVSQVAKVYCGESTQKVISISFALTHQDWQCEEYVSWQQCANPLTLILLVVVPIALIIAITMCVCCCCRACGRDKRTSVLA